MAHITSPVLFNRRRAGFSLIEVLIAVVVLSVGLLALGALQASLVRSSAEAKARAGALSLAEDRLERMRSFGDNYHGLTGTTETTADLGGTISGVDYTRRTTVQRYAYDRVSDAFVAVASTANGSLPAMGAAGAAPQWASGVEFKRIEVAVSWADAQGGNRTVRVTDSLSSVSPGSGLPATSVTRVGARSPRVLINNPENIPGVIPIAIGDGTDTAATNPRPEVAGQGNNQAVIETRFEVLTYQGISSDLAQVQARVETIVVGCTCDKTTGTGNGYRPTFWNGTHYVAPELTTVAPPAVHNPGGGNAPPQSSHCTACCRDHHDSGFSGPKFSPRRASHNHTGTYTEACRMIRVDGIVHTAADMSNDYFNLLATADDGDLPPPSTTASGNYESFVLRYLGDRMVSGTGYNTLPADLTVDGYEIQYNINEPLQIQLEASGDFKWLHSRGLYIDFLEADAITSINNAKTLTNCQGSALEGCVLRRVPFTSINLTELSNWTPAVGNQIVVTNNDFRQSLTSTDPVRGRVASVAATAGTTQQGAASIMNSNAGVALILNEINDEVVLGDAQPFLITGSSGPGPGGTAGTFGITIAGYPLSISANRLPAILFDPAVSGNICNHATSGGSRPNPYSCSTTNIGGAIALSVRNYNFLDSAQYSLTCTNSGAGSPASVSCNNNFPVCRNFALQSVTGGTVGAPTNNGFATEATGVSFTSVADAASLTMTFAEEAATRATTCSFSSGNNDSQRCNGAITNDPCSP